MIFVYSNDICVTYFIFHFFLLLLNVYQKGLSHLIRDRAMITHLRVQMKDFLAQINALESESQAEMIDRETSGAWSDLAILSVARLYIHYMFMK